MKIFILQATCLMLAGCASLLGGIIPSESSRSEDESSVETSTSEDLAIEKQDSKSSGITGIFDTQSTENSEINSSRHVTRSALQGLELKQARLWARVDELEDLIRNQKARIKMLEKGLLLGVVPSGFGDAVAFPVRQHQDEKPMTRGKRLLAKVSTQRLAEDAIKTASGDRPKALDASDDKIEFQRRMADARDLFRSGRYGKAYLSFSKIDKEFTAAGSTGEQKYWLGRCWYKLKEYQSARQHLQAFIGQYPTTPWALSAKFYLAKVEMDLGLKEAAIRKFQQIIRQNPYEGTAEAAKQILGTMHKAL